MTEYPKYRKLIEDYFEGGLSPSEEASLKSKLSTDPELNGEFELQKDIINTIKETRRIDLKNRLNNINIHWYHTVSNGWKVAATITSIVISGLAAYYFIDQENSNQDKIQIETQSNQLVVNEFEEASIPDKPILSKLEEAEDIPVIEEKQKISEPSPVPDKENEIKETQPAEEYAMEVVVPEVIENFDAVDDMEVENISESDIKSINPIKKDIYSSVEVESVIHKKYNFHYKFSGGMLTLYGNFEDVPYEILEINSAEGKRFFLNYKDNFYYIIQTTDIMQLESVTNEALLGELNIVKENK